MKEFFTRALSAADTDRGLKGRGLLFNGTPTALAMTIETEVMRFEFLQTQGVPVNPRYRIPERVIALAKKVIADHSPRTFPRLKRKDRLLSASRVTLGA
ncbi:hypothetical protein KGQ25_01590 [Patescibacteria group bacterium]|nr:hypothetical protein [Patescibacteria group bacterium]MDE2021502.1 hypothetical protein [Patescibacteria group bacterium]